MAELRRFALRRSCTVSPNGFYTGREQIDVYAAEKAITPTDRGDVYTPIDGRAVLSS